MSKTRECSYLCALLILDIKDLELLKEVSNGLVQVGSSHLVHIVQLFRRADTKTRVKGDDGMLEWAATQRLATF